MKIKELLTDKDKWTKHSMARDKEYCPVEPTDQTAVCWWALAKCYPDLKMQSTIERMILQRTGYNSLVYYNDTYYTSFEDVQRLVKELKI